MNQPDEAEYQIVASFLQDIRDGKAMEDDSLHEICLELDRLPTIRSRILTEANSASTGVWHRIDSVRHAATRLGIRRLEQILGKFVTSSNRTPPGPHFGQRAAS